MWYYFNTNIGENNMSNMYETIPQRVTAQQMTFDGLVSNNETKLPFHAGDWVVRSSSGIRVISDADFHKQYRKIPTVQPRQPIYPENFPPFPPKAKGPYRQDHPIVTFIATEQ